MGHKDQFVRWFMLQHALQQIWHAAEGASAMSSWLSATPNIAATASPCLHALKTLAVLLLLLLLML
jgi:hypothetical protein